MGNVNLFKYQLVGEQVSVCYGIGDTTGSGLIAGRVVGADENWLHIRTTSLHGTGGTIKLVAWQAIKYVSLGEMTYLKKLATDDTP